MKRRDSLVLIIAILMSIIFTGCATTHYSVKATNPQATNIRQIYIRNAGSASWGDPVQGNEIKNLDRKAYTKNVDVKVVDADGIVYSKYNVSLDENAFEITKQQGRTTLIIGSALFGAMLLLIIILNT